MKARYFDGVLSIYKPPFIYNFTCSDTLFPTFKVVKYGETWLESRLLDIDNEQGWLDMVPAISLYNVPGVGTLIAGMGMSFYVDMPIESSAVTDLMFTPTASTVYKNVIGVEIFFPGGSILIGKISPKRTILNRGVIYHGETQ